MKFTNKIVRRMEKELWFQRNEKTQNISKKQKNKTTNMEIC